MHSWLTVSQVHSETTRSHTHAALQRPVRYGPESTRTSHAITNQNRDIERYFFHPHYHFLDMGENIFIV